MPVVDIATLPAARVSLIERALDARKHVLSQKPFVLDLDVGEALVERADRNGVKLAVNQNGRWAPHFGYMREAVRAGAIGDVQSVHLGVHWDHTWTTGTPFADIEDRTSVVKGKSVSVGVDPGGRRSIKP